MNNSNLATLDSAVTPCLQFEFVQANSTMRARQMNTARLAIPSMHVVFDDRNTDPKYVKDLPYRSSDRDLLVTRRSCYPMPPRGRAPGPVTILRGHEGEVQCLEWIGAEGRMLVSGDINGNAIVWGLEQRRPVQTKR